jgi:transposase InsO family protein
VYCAVVLDTYSRRVVGWSIDASPTAALVTNALGMAIDARSSRTATITSTKAHGSSKPPRKPGAPRKAWFV